MERGAIVLALLAVVTLLGVRGWQGVAKSRSLAGPGEVAAAAGAERDLSCLATALHKVVPAGTTIYIDVENSFYDQILHGAAFPDRPVATTASAAGLVVQFRTPGAAAPCAPGALTARPPAAVAAP